MIYLASPYTHADAGVMEWRADCAAAAADALLSAGIAVYSPITHWRRPPGVLPLTWDFWSSPSLAFLDRCDRLLVLQLPGWRESTGVSAEMRHAKENSMPVSFAEPTWIADMARKVGHADAALRLEKVAGRKMAEDHVLRIFDPA